MFSRVNFLSDRIVGFGADVCIIWAFLSSYDYLSKLQVYARVALALRRIDNTTVQVYHRGNLVGFL